MSKEWLEEIRKLLVNLYNAVDVDEEMKHYIFNDLKIEWLIEQAECVQELKKENKRLAEKYEKLQERYLSGVELALIHAKFINQEYDIKKLREALEFYASGNHYLVYDDKIILSDDGETARKALEG